MKARFLHPMLIACLALFGAILLLGTPAEAATVVALGASNTYGKGVARNQAYPAQLEAILRARGSGCAGPRTMTPCTPGLNAGARARGSAADGGAA